jgi:exosortase B
MSANVLSSLSPSTQVGVRAVDLRLVWLPIIAGALLLYVPAYLDVASAIATNEGGAQQPVCLAIWIWMLWRNRTEFTEIDTENRSALGGWLLIAGATALYAIGRSQEFLQLEIGSQVLLFVGIVLVLLKRGALRRLWFPALFLVFLVPVPGSLLNAILIPLKKIVSTLVAQLLYSAGLPVARDGVVLYVGHYQLLIADACSGLNSMVALSAIGFLYVYLAGYRRWLPNALLLAAVLPIAFLANVLRVAGLVLTTYYAGDEAGQRFHIYAAFAEILLVFGLFFVLDRLIRACFTETRQQLPGEWV